MSSVPRHIIKRQVLEFRGLTEADAHGIQQRFSPLFREQVLPLIDRYCSQLSADGTPYRIDRLELDLGSLAAADLEEEFVRTVSAHLAAYFEPLIQAQAAGAETPAVPRPPHENHSLSQKNSPSPEEEPLSRTPAAAQSRLELFRYFVETGSLPWWADLSEPDPLGDSLRYLLANAPETLTRWLAIWAKRESYLRRIVRQLRYPTWVSLIALALERPTERLVPLVDGIVRLLHNSPPWQRKPVFRLREQLGIKLLAWAGTSTGKSPAPAAFWQDFLLQLAGEQSRYAPEELIKFWYEELQRAGTTGRAYPATLIAVVAQLRQTVATAEEMKPHGAAQWEDVITSLQRLLKRPSLPAELKTALRDLLAYFSNAKADVPDRYFSDSVASAERIAALRQMSDQLSAAVSAWGNQRGPHATDPTVFAERIAALRQMLDQLSAAVSAWGNQRGLHAATDPTIFAERITALRRIIDQLSVAISAEFDSPGRSNLPEAELVPEPDPFSDTEELYVGNAGLVILWPFLPRFFENLGLVAERAFVDAAAAHRAVGLLQFLADGQPEPAEYHCGLNKILCGLDWDAVLDFGEPVTEAEAAAGEEFLQAVIAHAPILQEMSVDGFRGSFLLRQGILRSGPGMWQLQVERKDYDIVLEKFPWKWQTVKLPWMRWGVGVEW